MKTTEQKIKEEVLVTYKYPTYTREISSIDNRLSYHYSGIRNLSLSESKFKSRQWKTSYYFNKLVLESKRVYIISLFVKYSDNIPNSLDLIYFTMVLLTMYYFCYLVSHIKSGQMVKEK